MDPGERDAIAQFWSWWKAARDRITAAIVNGSVEAMTGELGEKVAAIHPGLDWELAPGITAEHAFCISAKGDPELRVITETWRLRGPIPDATWEYHAARQAGVHHQGVRLQMAGHDLALDDLIAAFAVNAGRERIDVNVFHPAFAQIADARLRTRIAFIVLDHALGEDGVERWLGAIEAATTVSDDARPLGELLAAVDRLQRSATGEKFSSLRGTDPEGRPMFAMVNRALKRIDHLLCSMHISVDLAIVDPDEHGLVKRAEAEDLNALEDELTAKLTGGGAVYLGRETGRGRRVLHYYAPEDSTATAIIASWARGHAARDPQVVVERDVAWQFAKRFG